MVMGDMEALFVLRVRVGFTALVAIVITRRWRVRREGAVMIVMRPELNQVCR